MPLNEMTVIVLVRYYLTITPFPLHQYVEQLGCSLLHVLFFQEPPHGVVDVIVLGGSLHGLIRKPDTCTTTQFLRSARTEPTCTDTSISNQCPFTRTLPPYETPVPATPLWCFGFNRYYRPSVCAETKYEHTCILNARCQTTADNPFSILHS